MLNSYAGTTAHLVSEGTKSLLLVTVRTAEMCVLGCSVLAGGLNAEATSHIISLMFVELFDSRLWTRCFRQSPSWHVLLSRRVGCRFWNIATRTNSSWSRDLVLETSTSTSPTECVLGLLDELWSVLDQILWAGVCIVT